MGDNHTTIITPESVKTLSYERIKELKRVNWHLPDAPERDIHITLKRRDPNLIFRQMLAHTTNRLALAILADHCVIEAATKAPSKHPYGAPSGGSLTGSQPTKLPVWITSVEPIRFSIRDEITFDTDNFTLLVSGHDHLLTSEQKDTLMKFQGRLGYPGFRLKEGTTDPMYQFHKDGTFKATTNLTRERKHLFETMLLPHLDRIIKAFT